MKILWISNVLFPEACQALNIKEPVVGGWMHSAAIALLESNPNIKLTVVSLYSGNVLKEIEKYQITYFLVPDKGGDQHYNSLLESYYREIKNKSLPDIVHIHGSEYPHSLAWVKSCGNKNVVVSIQGLVSVIANYFLGGICREALIKSITFRDIIRRDSLFSQQKRMIKRGRYERELLAKVDYIIGRTTWDKSNSWEINPLAKYYHCNETLRKEFYNAEWKYELCTKHSIFLSQVHYPIKGLQQLIKALPVVLTHFPDAKVYIAGNNFLQSSIYRRNGFANYLLKEMKKSGIADKFIFLGVLGEKEMVNQYLKSNVFVCPSIIENSPNSVGEAQLVGTPCISSYVGGSMDMIEDHETGFIYRFEETNLLAMRICEIFSNKDLAETIGRNARIVASGRHNKIQNAESLNHIYKTILDENIPDL